MNLIKIAALAFIMLMPVCVQNALAAEGWYVQTRLAELTDSKDNTMGLFIHRAGFKGKQHQVYLKYAGIRHSERERFSLVHRYSLNMPKPHQVILRNTIDYDRNTQNWQGEITPIYMYQLTEKWQIGAEFEIDYYQKDKFGIAEIEIEPTIKYKTRIGQHKLLLELEAPVTRLYSRQDKPTKFKVESYDVLARYTIPLSLKTSVALEALIKHDAIKKQSSETFGLRFRHWF
ncbi:MAG: hypothetical protein V3V09_01810 [Arenicellales bacterium]